MELLVALQLRPQDRFPRDLVPDRLLDAHHIPLLLRQGTRLIPRPLPYRAVRSPRFPGARLRGHLAAASL